MSKDKNIKKDAKKKPAKSAKEKKEAKKLKKGAQGEGSGERYKAKGTRYKV